eukprot:SAG22_NODE_2117_length_2985_cov_6.178794_3_plen_578_part_00
MRPQKIPQNLRPRGSRVDDARDESRMILFMILLAAALALRCSDAAAPSARGGGKIDHFVVLLMENRPFDQMLGCLAGEGELAAGATGIGAEGRSIPIDAADPTKGSVNVTCGTGAYVCRGGGYAPWSPKFASNGSDAHFYPYGEQGDQYSFKNGAKPGDAIHMFSGAQLPIKREIAREVSGRWRWQRRQRKGAGVAPSLSLFLSFSPSLCLSLYAHAHTHTGSSPRAVPLQFGVFNKYFASVPSYSTPNHLFIQSATSCGVSSNGGFPASVCGAGTGRNSSTALFPMKTIFDSMAEALPEGAASFGFYINDTHPRGNETHNDTLAVYSPDTMMAGVARYRERYMSYANFFDQVRATAGTHALSMPRQSRTSGSGRSLARAPRLALVADNAWAASPLRHRLPRARCRRCPGSCRRGTTATTPATTSRRGSGCSRTSTKRCAPGRAGTRRSSGQATTTPVRRQPGPLLFTAFLFLFLCLSLWFHCPADGGPLCPGGMYDQVVPPHEGVPSDDAPCHVQKGACSVQTTPTSGTKRVHAALTAVFMVACVAMTGATGFGPFMGMSNLIFFLGGVRPTTIVL